MGVHVHPSDGRCCCLDKHAQSAQLLVDEAEADGVNDCQPARRSTGRPDASYRRTDAGVTVTEMLVALMILTIGVLGIYQLFATSAVATSTSANRVSAQQLASAELEAVRALPYESVAMTSTNVDNTMFDSLTLVGPTTKSRVDPKSVVTRNGIEFTVWRKVGWKPVVAGGTTYSRTVKLVTVVVTWQDDGRTQQRKVSSAVTKAQTNG